MPPPKTARSKAQIAKANTHTQARGNTPVSPTPEPEQPQDINDEIEGRNFLEKHLLLCPPGEPSNHNSLATCLHQVSEMAGVSKPVKNAIRSIAFLLGEIEETQINAILKDAFDTQITELTSDMATLIENAKEKLDLHFKDTEDRLSQLIDKVAAQPRQTHPATYASAIANPPPHVNPRVAAKEGIKARQFLMEGIANTKFSHTDPAQLKSEINKIIGELGLQNGKVRSINKLRSGGALLEMDSDAATTWLADQDNRSKLCSKIGTGVVFRTRVHNLIAFNVPLDITPEDKKHRDEICEANNMEAEEITSMKWIKPIHRRTASQRTAHLTLTFTTADSANRAITNGLYICNRRCQVERVKREPTRCLKCQGWNHFAKECLEDKDTCGNCAKEHRTSDCPTPLSKCCVSCKAEDHASWSMECPTFIRKLDDLNTRNPENTLQFIPTADPWTWTSSVKPTPPPLPPASRPAVIRSRSQPPRKLVPPTRRVDSYVPKYDSYIPSYDKSGKRTHLGSRDWSDEDPAQIPKDLTEFRPLTQGHVDANNHEQNSGPTSQVPALTITRPPES
jgi:hypothetical protein